ncbi:hypothetical protein pb186bvf_007725 [Paramecium bursaria]
MQYCKIQYHDRELAQFICLSPKCDQAIKLCCSKCKTNFHSQCGIQCVQHNDLKQFFQQYQNIQLKDIFKAKLRELFIPIEQKIDDLVNNQQNNIDNFDLLRNLCQLYSEKQIYDGEDCQFVSDYFKDKISIDFINQTTKIVLKSNLDEVDQLIKTQSQNIINIIENIYLQFSSLAQQDIFTPNIQQNLLQYDFQINQNNPVLIKKDFKIISHINLQFQLYKGVIQESQKQKQVLIFEPKLDQDRYWGFKIVKMSNMLKDNYLNIWTEQGVLGFGVVDEFEKLKEQHYCYDDLRAFIIFSTGKTNSNQLTNIAFKDYTNIIFDYYHDRKELKATAFEDKVSFTFKLQQNITYYPCLVISRGDAIAFLQENEVDLLRNS